MQSTIPDEIIIVDQTREHNPETDAFLSHCCATIPGFIWIYLFKPSGVVSRNLGIITAKSDILVFLDDDVLLSTSFIQGHLSCFSDSSICAATGPVLSKDGCFQFQWNREQIRNDPKYFTPTGPIIIPGGNFSLRRSAAIEIGGFDERFVAPGLAEDFDLGFRLSRSGFRIAYSVEAGLVHLKVPAGGCRGTKKRSITLWKRIHGICLFSLRSRSLYRFLASARHGPLLSYYIKRPWLQPWAWASLFLAICIAFRDALLGPKSEIIKTKRHEK